MDLATMIVAAVFVCALVSIVLYSAYKIIQYAIDGNMENRYSYEDKNGVECVVDGSDANA